MVLPAFLCVFTPWKVIITANVQELSDMVTHFLTHFSEIVMEIPLVSSVICVECLSFALMISFVPFPSQPILTLCLDKNSELDCLIVSPLDQCLCLGFL